SHVLVQNASTASRSSGRASRISVLGMRYSLNCCFHSTTFFSSLGNVTGKIGFVNTHHFFDTAGEPLALTPQRLRRFAKCFCVVTGWAAFGPPTSHNTQEKTSRAAASSHRTGFSGSIFYLEETYSMLKTCYQYPSDQEKGL